MKKSKKRRVSIKSDRYQTSYENKDKGGAGGKGILDFSAIKKKPGFFEPRAGINKVNIIPYPIKTKKHPQVAAGKMEIGDYDYNVDIFVHRGIGPDENQSVICPKKTYGKKCPICEAASDFYNDGKKDEGKALLPSRRVIYNLQQILKGEIQDLTIWEVSHYLFEKELIEEAHECSNGEDIIPFADPDEGCLVKFRGSTKKFGKNEYLEYKSFDFIDREEEIDDETLEAAVSLDELLVVLSYEEIEKIFYGQEDDDDDDEDATPKKSRKKKVTDDDDEEEEDEEEVVTKKTRKKKIVEEDEEEEGDEDADEEPAPKKSKKKSKSKCPAGGVFGKDFEEFDECEGCPLWEECAEEA